MKLTQLKGTPQLASPTLEDWGKVGKPLGEPVSALRGVTIDEDDGAGYSCGIWECSPGRWRREDSTEQIAVRARDAANRAITRVMIMDQMETPRETFILNKGNYESKTDVRAYGVNNISDLLDLLERGRDYSRIHPR